MSVESNDSGMRSSFESSTNSMSPASSTHHSSPEQHVSPTTPPPAYPAQEPLVAVLNNLSITTPGCSKDLVSPKMERETGLSVDWVRLSPSRSGFEPSTPPPTANLNTLVVPPPAPRLRVNSRVRTNSGLLAGMRAGDDDEQELKERLKKVEMELCSWVNANPSPFERGSVQEHSAPMDLASPINPTFTPQCSPIHTVPPLPVLLEPVILEGDLISNPMAFDAHHTHRSCSRSRSRSGGSGRCSPASNEGEMGYNHSSSQNFLASSNTKEC